MTTARSLESFSLLGGPLYELGRRLGLVRGETNTVLLGVALGWGLCLLIVALTLIEGVTNEVFSMLVVGAHARLLLVIPLFFVCESWVVPRMAAFVGTMTRSGVVPPDAGRTKGVGRYMGLATRYVAEFEAKWLGDDIPTDAPLLGSPDLQSLADLANAVSVVKGMR